MAKLQSPINYSSTNLEVALEVFVDLAKVHYQLTLGKEDHPRRCGHVASCRNEDCNC